MSKEVNELSGEKSITTFNDLPSELILGIFEYLSVIDRYQSFYEYDTRLRQLVKRWTSYSKTALNLDIEQFSTLRSWYKHLSFKDGGSEFILFPKICQQHSHINYSDITDTPSFHWIFFQNSNRTVINNERVREILLRHSFRLNPFFYHQCIDDSPRLNPDGTQSPRRFCGGHIITMDRFREYFEPWIKSHYPEIADRILKSSRFEHNIDEILAPVFEAEWLKAKQVMQEAAHKVWEDLKGLDNINPLRKSSWAYVRWP
ncbi:unnamed protein product [Rotaria sp. Silwood1]|nr:unnamed protein product [Rotaria sp. Silwood1]